MTCAPSWFPPVSCVYAVALIAEKTPCLTGTAASVASTAHSRLYSIAAARKKQRLGRCRASARISSMDAPQLPSAESFARPPLPRRLCNLDRLLHAMEARGLDGIVATTPWNVFYLT